MRNKLKKKRLKNTEFNLLICVVVVIGDKVRKIKYISVSVPDINLDYGNYIYSMKNVLAI